MNAPDPLANLRDIHLPGEIGWWPLATGWWILITLVVIVAGWSIYQLVQRHKRAAILREVMHHLDKIDDEFSTTNDQQQLVRSYSQLLRRLVIQHRGRKDGAAVTGNNWLEILLEYQPAADSEDPQLKLLTEGQYQAKIEVQEPEVLGRWVRNCAQAICLNLIRGSHHA
jgi:hypothetical protein